MDFHWEAFRAPAGLQNLLPLSVSKAERRLISNVYKENQVTNAKKNDFWSFGAAKLKGRVSVNLLSLCCNFSAARGSLHPTVGPSIIAGSFYIPVPGPDLYCKNLSPGAPPMQTFTPQVSGIDPAKVGVLLNVGVFKFNLHNRSAQFQ